VRWQTDLVRLPAIWFCASDSGVPIMSDGTRSGLSGEFNTFLYSAVSDDSDPMPVSVLSALARQNIDPWHEAAQLAQMPKRVAITRLASMISTVKSDLTPQAPAELIATRLIGLLPAPSVLGMPRLTAIPAYQPGQRLRLLAGIAFGIFLLALIVFGG
jgi:hypothetical protein